MHGWVVSHRCTDCSSNHLPLFPSLKSAIVWLLFHPPLSHLPNKTTNNPTRSAFFGSDSDILRVRAPSAPYAPFYCIFLYLCSSRARINHVMRNSTADLLEIMREAHRFARSIGATDEESARSSGGGGAETGGDMETVTPWGVRTWR